MFDSPVKQSKKPKRKTRVSALALIEQEVALPCVSHVKNFKKRGEGSSVVDRELYVVAGIHSRVNVRGVLDSPRQRN